MNNRRQTLLMLGATLAYAGVAPGQLWACGLEGGPGNGFSAAAPGSIDVAIAITEAIDAGLLDPTTTPGGGAAQRASDLGAAIDRVAASSTSSPPFALFLVDSSLWARLAPGYDVAIIAVDDDGAPPEKVIVVTGEAVIAAIMSGRLSARDAYRRKLVMVDGAGPQRQQVAQVMAQALALLENNPRG
jgi:hypothetical protein